MINQRVQTVLNGETDFVRWSQPENLESEGDERSILAANLIPKGSRILDLGCGKMLIEKYLHPLCIYFPSDIVKRDERTLHCEINKGEIPSEINQVDIILLLGVIEYVFNIPTLLKTLERSKKKIIVSYCDTENSNFKEFNQRAEQGWVNSLSKSELRTQFDNAGLKVIAEDPVDNIQSIYTLVPKKSEVQTKRVAVVSFSNLGNFGDRLGMHLLSSIMPSHAIVDCIYFNPWLESEEEYDLLIVGIGNSVFAPLPTHNLFNLIKRSKVSIGIFGTQYRENYPAEQMKRLINSLDYWFARYEEDYEQYATSDTICAHLGDWLIREFMITKPSQQDKVLKIGNEIWNNLPLDRVIQQIHSYRKVNSERLHPLLCALTSADEVAYKEQRESGSEIVSGKFQSMLLDIFGRSFPENRFWTVDRSAVIHYRQKVMENIKSIERRILEVL